MSTRHGETRLDVTRLDETTVARDQDAAGGAHEKRRLTALRGDDGMATAEYAIVTLAAAGFAGLLAVILRSPEVRVAITSIIRSALSG